MDVNKKNMIIMDFIEDNNKQKKTLNILSLYRQYIYKINYTIR